MAVTLPAFRMAGALAAEAGYSRTKYCKIYFSNDADQKRALGIKPYADTAFMAAYKTIGTYYYYPNQGKLFNIKLYSANDGANGYMQGGKQDIYLNTNYLGSKTYAAWGNVIAHEAAHILFFNQTYADRWNSGLNYYRVFLTEALSWYAGDCVYGWTGTTSGTYSKTGGFQTGLSPVEI